jgi:hypothetical protein
MRYAHGLHGVPVAQSKLGCLEQAIDNHEAIAHAVIDQLCAAL